MKTTCLLLAALWTASAEPPLIALRVYDYAGLPAGTVVKAGLEARKIFAKAGGTG